MTDQSQLPVVPDPTIVTSELPVVGSLLLTTLLLACTNVHPAVMVPNRPLASTVLTKLSDHPPPLLLFDATALSDLHVTPIPSWQSALVMSDLHVIPCPIPAPSQSRCLWSVHCSPFHCLVLVHCTSTLQFPCQSALPHSLAPVRSMRPGWHCPHPPWREQTNQMSTLIPRSSFHRSAPLQSCLIQPSCWPPQSTHSCFPSRLHCTVQHCCSTVHPTHCVSSCSTHTRSWSLPQSEMYSLQSLLPCCAPMSPRSTRSTRCCSHPSALFQSIHSSPCSDPIPPLSHSEILSLPCSSTPDCLIAVRLWSPPMLSSTLAAIHPSSQLLPVQDPLLHPRHSCIAGSMSIATHSMWLGFVRIHE